MVSVLVIFLLIIVFLAFFVGKNLSNTCTLWLFKSLTNVPVSVLVLTAFAAGIVFSIIALVIFKLKGKKKKALKQPAELEKSKEKETVADK